MKYCDVMHLDTVNIISPYKDGTDFNGMNIDTVKSINSYKEGIFCCYAYLHC